MPYLAVVLVIFVVGGHIALWLSDAPAHYKLRLTMLNAAGWAVIIFPAIGVSYWLKAKTKDRD